MKRSTFFIRYVFPVLNVLGAAVVSLWLSANSGLDCAHTLLGLAGAVLVGTVVGLGLALIDGGWAKEQEHEQTTSDL